MHVRHLSKRRADGTTLAAAITLVAGVALSASPSRAAMYSYLYATRTTNFTAAAGSSLTVNVYLEETANASAVTPSLINDEVGLSGAAFSLAAHTASPASTITNAAGNAGVTATGFSGVINATHTPVLATVSEAVDQSVDPFAPGVDAFPILGAGFSGAFLGTVTIHVGAAGSSTQFDLGPLVGDSTVTNLNSHDLDDSDDTALYESAAQTSFTVTATAAAAPEPSSLAALVLAGVALRRRRLA